MTKAQLNDSRLSDRFWEKVSLDSETGCWIWVGAISGTGYGSFKPKGEVRQSTHRFAYLKLVGAVAPGLDLDHLCRVRACCNPNHLEPVTRGENARRGDCGRHLKERTHCPKGHPYAGDNLRIRKDRGGTGRVCKACLDEARTNYVAKQPKKLRKISKRRIREINRLMESA